VVLQHTIGEISRKFFLFIPLFLSNSPTGQNVHHIFTLNGSNDADSRKGVPFLAFVDITHHFGDQIAGVQLVATKMETGANLY